MSLADDLRTRLARKSRVENERSRASRPTPTVVGAGASATPSARYEAVPERRVAGFAWVLAVAAIAAALILNWVNSPSVVGGSLNAGSSGTPGIPSPTAVLNLPTVPSRMLPSQVIAYEVIESHAMPGQEKTAAEAIYQTYNMNITLAVPLVVYAHVQGYNTAGEAQTALTALMAKYPVKRVTRMVGPVQAAETGYTADEGALIVVWAKGRYVTYVKTSFLDHIPAQKRNFLSLNGEPVVLAVEEYERTGKQGAEGNADIYKNVPKKKSKDSSASAGSAFGNNFLGAP